MFEAESEHQARVNACQRAKRSGMLEYMSIKLLDPAQVDLERKKLKDRRKLRYQTPSY